MAFAETQKLTVQLDLGGNFQAKIGSAARALQGLDRSTSRTQQSLSKFGRNIERGIVIGAGAAAAGFIGVAKAAGDFEAQMNTIATIVDRNDIPKIGAALRKTARDTGLSLDDLTSAYYDLASAGVKGELATAALNDAVTLGIGGLATTAETVDLLTTAINAYGLDAKGAATATDQFALAVADGKVKASEISATFANVASLAKTYSIGIDQIAASYAVLTAQGVPASEVTTEMQRAIISLINPSKDLEDAQKRLKISFTEEIRKKGLVPALQELRTYSDKTGIPLIALLGRIEAVKYTLQTTGDNFAPFNAELAKMGKASGTAAAQMAERQQGLNFQLNRLKALAKDAGITIGSALLPKLTPLVEKLNSFISNNQDKIGQFGTQLASGFENIANAVQKVDWQPFIDGLKLSGEIAKTVIGAFRSLPPDLQKLVVAGFALNKVTGGLGTSLVKDLGGAILGKLAGLRGSSPQNALWVRQAGIAGGSGPIKGGGVESLVAKVFLIGAAVGAFAELKGILDDQTKANKTQEAGLSEQSALFVKGGSIDDMKRALAALQDTSKLSLAEQAALLFNIDGVNDSILAQQKVLRDAIAARERQNADRGLDSPATHSAPGVGTGAGIARAIGTAVGTAVDHSLDSAALRGDVRGLGNVIGDKLLTFGTLGQRLMSAAFVSFARQLAHPKSPAELKLVADRLTKLITAGHGDAKNTEGVLKSLRKQLANTHDPKTAASLRADIHKVEGLLPGRQFAAMELTAAKKVLRSNETSNIKLAELKVIEQALKDRGLPHAAAVIAAKIEQAKKEQKAASDRTTAAVKRKKELINVNVSVPVSTYVSGRDVVRSVTKAGRFGIRVT